MILYRLKLPNQENFLAMEVHPFEAVKAFGFLFELFNLSRIVVD